MPCMHVERTFAGALMFLSLTGMCLAQGSRGSITGKVTDQQNSVIPRERHGQKDLLTGVTTKTVTNQTGYYEANFLDPGTYSVTVGGARFKVMLRSGNRSGNRRSTFCRRRARNRPSQPVRGSHCGRSIVRHHLRGAETVFWPTAKSRNCRTPP